jgi:hypothetical protein
MLMKKASENRAHRPLVVLTALIAFALLADSFAFERLSSDELSAWSDREVPRNVPKITNCSDSPGSETFFALYGQTETVRTREERLSASRGIWLTPDLTYFEKMVLFSRMLHEDMEKSEVTVLLPKQYSVHLMAAGSLSNFSYEGMRLSVVFGTSDSRFVVEWGRLHLKKTAACPGGEVPLDYMFSARDMFARIRDVTGEPLTPEVGATPVDMSLLESARASTFRELYLSAVAGESDNVINLRLARKIAAADLSLNDRKWLVFTLMTPGLPLKDAQDIATTLPGKWTDPTADSEGTVTVRRHDEAGFWITLCTDSQRAEVEAIELSLPFRESPEEKN